MVAMPKKFCEWLCQCIGCIKNRRTAPERLLWTRLTFSKSVMCLDVSEMGRTDLIFIDPGVKINGAYYREVFDSKAIACSP